MGKSCSTVATGEYYNYRTTVSLAERPGNNDKDVVVNYSIKRHFSIGGEGGGGGGGGDVKGGGEEEEPIVDYVIKRHLDGFGVGSDDCVVTANMVAREESDDNEDDEDDDEDSGDDIDHRDSVSKQLVRQADISSIC